MTSDFVWFCRCAKRMVSRKFTMDVTFESWNCTGRRSESTPMERLGFGADAAVDVAAKEALWTMGMRITGKRF